jgi:hypothetical protein
MSESNTSTGARVVQVAAGLENTGRSVPVRDSRHEALGILIGKWINEGHTVATAEVSSVPILTSDAYEWATSGFFVVHSAYGRIGEASVGGVEILGVNTRCLATFTDGGLTQWRTTSPASIAPPGAPRWRSP